MKKKILFLIIMTFTLIGIVKADVSVTGLTDNIENHVLGKGESVTLTPTVQPSDATNKKVIFSTQTEECISVSAEGVVTTTYTGTGSCTDTVVAKTEDGEKTHDYRITVTNKITINKNEGIINCTAPVEGKYGKWYYELTQDEVIIRADDSVKLEDIFSAYSYYKDKYNCTISKEGKYFSGWFAEATGGQVLDDKTSIKELTTIYPHWSDSAIPIESIKIKNNGINMAAINQTSSDPEYPTNIYQLVVEYTPYYASNKNITWTSSKTDVATVDANGLVTAVALGDSEMKAVSEDGNKESKFVIRVSEHEVNNYLTPQTQTIKVGDKLQFHYYQLGPMVANGFPSFVSSDPTIAKFEESETPGISTGVLVALKPGKVTVTAKYGDSFGSTAEITIVDDGGHHAEDYKFLIKFEGGEGATGTMENQPYYDGVTNTLKKNEFKRDKYIFVGWKAYLEDETGARVEVKIDGKELIFKDGQELQSLTLPEGRNLVLVAQWVTNPDTGSIGPVIAIAVLLLIGGYLYFIKSRRFNKIAKL